MASGYREERRADVRRKGAQEEAVIQILIIGKSGNGKSSTGNVLLGKKAFEVTTGINTCTEHIQFAEASRTHQNSSFQLQVVDLPDVCNAMDEAEQAEEIQRCKTLTFPAPTMVCVMARADVRFTPREYSNYRTTVRLLGRHASEGRQAKEGSEAPEEEMPDNLVVIFTMADKLTVEQQSSFKEEVQKANKELRQVVEDAHGRFVLISNEDDPRKDATPHDNADASSPLSRVMDMALHMHSARPTAVKSVRAMLLGSAGSGKSATGNSLLHPSAYMEPSSVTRSCKTAAHRVLDYDVEITDTPSLSDDSDANTLSRKIHSWITSLHHVPHVLLFVLRAHNRFQERDFHLFTALKSTLGKDITERIVVVFTGGDKLEQGHTTMETLLKKAPEDLKRLLDEVEHRYIVINNQATTQVDKLLQRNGLLEAIVRLVDSKKGKPMKVPHKAVGHQRENMIPKGGRIYTRKDSTEGQKNLRLTAPPKSHSSSTSSSWRCILC